MDGTDFVVRAPPDSLSEQIRRFMERELVLARLVRVAWKRARAAAPTGAGAGPASRLPNQNDYPSTWPPALLEEAQRLTRHILRRFQEEVQRDGRRFAVLYVPRGNQELEGRLRPDDSWFPWLSRTCAELGIRLLDPRDRLRTHHAAGATIYDDHWAPAGHALIGAFVAETLAAGYVAEPTEMSTSRARRPSSGR